MASGPSAAEIKKFSSKTLKVGSKGPAVGCFQKILSQDGAKVEADEKFGSGTKKAVVAFQKKKKLTADGIVGPNTWAAASGKSPPKEKEKEKPDPKEPKQAEAAPNANQCTINVRVVCSAGRGKQPVQGADVKIGKVKKKTATRGDASLVVKPGRYTAEVSKRGYEMNAERSVEIRAIAGGTLDVLIEMQATS